MDNKATMTAANTAPPGELALPPFESCMTAASSIAKSGIDALSALSDSLQQRCPGLAGILQSSAVRKSLETYKRQDAEAARQQANLMRDANWANVCLMTAGVTSGLVLWVAAQPSTSVLATYLATYLGKIGNITLALGIVTLLLGAAGAFFGHLMRDQGQIGRWQACRSEAEVARLAVFNTIASKAADAGPAVALYCLALVVCHLLDDQRTWLGQRALRHRESSETTSRWGALASALAFIGGSGAIISSQVKDSVWIVLAGVIGTAIAGYSTNRDALRRDRANADRYEKVQVALDGLAGRTDDVATRISAGEPKALVAFTDAVSDLLATEHKQWLEGTAQAETSLGKLDAQLEQLTKENK
jgi:hypothetical protein